MSHTGIHAGLAGRDGPLSFVSFDLIRNLQECSFFTTEICYRQICGWFVGLEVSHRFLRSVISALFGAQKNLDIFSIYLDRGTLRHDPDGFMIYRIFQELKLGVVHRLAPSYDLTTHGFYGFAIVVSSSKYCKVDWCGNKRRNYVLIYSFIASHLPLGACDN